MGASGRPTKYTRERAQIIYDAIAKGYYAEDAAALAGISRDTYYQWLKDHDEFSDTICRKMAESQELPLNLIRLAMVDGNVDAAFKFLARRFPHQWGEKTANTHEHTGTLKLQIEFTDGYAGIAQITQEPTSDS